MNAQIRIVRIRDVDWKLTDIDLLNVSEKELKAVIAIGINGSHKVDPEKKLLVLRLTIDYTKRSEDSAQESILSYTNEGIFLIANFSEVIQKLEGEQYSLPSFLLESLVSIMLSTIRGILIEKMANTYLRDFYLPILNPKEITAHIFGE